METEGTEHYSDPGLVPSFHPDKIPNGWFFLTDCFTDIRR